ncbi:MAG: Gfo/Idh/MocA family oxidoreductase [Planctomycetaceae bacterium]|nr:Gfo/Idh/MocA family oxidoreductase [Planctomycetaceae bacterium]
MNQINRRRFLGSVSLWGGAAGLAVVQPAQVRGTAANSRLKLGVVGCGGRGHWIANLFAQHGGYELHAVADYFADVVQNCGEQLQVDPARRFSGLAGYQALMESGIDAVALETPPYCFPQHVRRAVESGLHVFMAKPVAVDVPGTLEIARWGRQAGQQGQCFLVDYQIPTDPLNQEVVRRIRDGAIGPLLMVRTHYLAGTFSDPPLTESVESRLRNLVWVNDTALGGGYHVNACIHGVDGGLWLLDQQPIAATGVSRIGRSDPHGDSHDMFSICFEFADGTFMNHVGSHLNSVFDVRCVAYGQAGNAEIGYTGTAQLNGESAYEGGQIENLYQAGAVRNIARFHDAIQSGDASNTTLAPALRSALATILGREAAARRTRLTMEELMRENRSIPADLSGLALDARLPGQVHGI